jgi:histidine decarboxylase
MPDVTERLLAFKNNIDAQYPLFIGFPGSVDFDYKEIYPLFDYLLNNVGDPYVEPLHALHSAAMEREVIEFFADLFRAPQADRWGYVTTGGTEGNLYALYVARELLPDAQVFYSAAAHYSIPKNTYILNQKTVTVNAQKSGEMDYKDLRAQLKGSRGKPVIIVATIGTTMTEAKDNIAVIKQILADCEVGPTYIHCDAALAGVYTALIEPHYPFDFADGADSISISGHKFIGSPMACGVVIVRKGNRDLIQRSAFYTGSPDTTIGGSRNGHTPIFLWYAIQRWGIEGFRARITASLELAAYAQAELQRIGWQTWRNPNAITVMLTSPPRELIYKWQLATYDGWSHIICMPGVNKERVDAFIADLAALPSTAK